ncbi:MAG: RecX family transcriptional regulator [Clostridia bacterium]|nr:RecX family transcriptional regulator [Clostridia bacterium]
MEKRKKDKKDSMYTVEEFDKEKTKVLKYVMYNKRTIQEIKLKFKNQVDENMLEDIIEELKENGYISDENYVKRAVNEFMALKNLSVKEIKYKLGTKGISNNLIEDYIAENREELEEYEQQSADNIALKKSVNMDEMEIKQYLIKKGYSEDSIKEAIRKIEE